MPKKSGFNLKILASLAIFALIIIAVVLIYLLNIGNLPFLNEQQPSSNLKNYQVMKQKIIDLGKDPSISSQSLYTKFVSEFLLLEQPGLKDTDKYQALQKSYIFLNEFYSVSNNSKLYPFEKDFIAFAKDNFPNQFHSYQFPYFCQDPSCSTSSVPQDILNTIEDVKNSDFPTDVQQTTITDLQNISYLPQNNKFDIFDNYAFMAALIRSYSGFTKNNSNIKISNDIYRFLYKNYSEQYASALKSPQASASGILDFNKTL